MELNKKTIDLYINETRVKILQCQTDIGTFEYRIKQTYKEIETLKYFLEQYEKALELIEEIPEEDNGQENQGNNW